VRLALTSLSCRCNHLSLGTYDLIGRDRHRLVGRLKFSIPSKLWPWRLALNEPACSTSTKRKKLCRIELRKYSDSRLSSLFVSSCFGPVSRHLETYEELRSHACKYLSDVESSIKDPDLPHTWQENYYSGNVQELCEWKVFTMRRRIRKCSLAYDTLLGLRLVLLSAKSCRLLRYSTSIAGEWGTWGIRAGETAIVWMRLLIHANLTPRFPSYIIVVSPGNNSE
jgi:hypothetical protein